MTVRPIDANIAMKKIREYMEDFPNATTRLAACRAILSMLGDKNQIPTLTPQNEWVSVEERLPDSQEDVLVVAFWHEHWQTMMGWHSDLGKKWRVSTPHGEREPDGVTYWMSLPAPPDCRPPEGEEDT